jgi:hypothetical protein
MAKIPKLSELTDLKKLKELGSSIASQAKVGEFIDKMKSGVDSLTSGNKPGVEVDEEDAADLIKSQFIAISQSLTQIMAQHKAQAIAINELNKQIKNLYALLSSDDGEPEEPTEGQHSRED